MRERARGAAASAERRLVGRQTGAYYEAYSERVYRFCLRRLGDREEALDVLQDTFLNAQLGLERGVTPERPLDWLYAIARNLCNSRHRARFVRRGTVRLDEAAVTGATGDMHDDVATVLLPLLAQLPDTQRRALLLRELCGLSYQEIGVELELSYPAVASLIFRARRTLIAATDEQRTTHSFRNSSAAGGTFAALKALLAGSAAMQVVAATAVVVTTVTLAHPATRPPAPLPSAPTSERQETSPPAGGLLRVASAHVSSFALERAPFPARSVARGDRARFADVSEDVRPAAESSEAQQAPPSTTTVAQTTMASPAADTYTAQPESGIDETSAGAGGGTRTEPTAPPRAIGSAAGETSPIGAGEPSGVPAAGQGDAPPAGTVPPGHGGTPPGHGGTPPGQGITPPGRGGTPPGQTTTPPGHGGTPPGQGDASSGQGGTPAGQTTTPPGPGGTSPGQGGTPPRQDATSPGQASARPDGGDAAADVAATSLSGEAAEPGAA